MGLDLGIARGLDYYTGLIYETELTELPGIGSVMSGGRYDGLMSMFGAPEHPAVGISLGVDRLFAALQEMGRLGERALAEVAVLRFSEEDFVQSFAIAQAFRARGVSAEVVLGAPKLKKQLRAADRAQIPFAVLQGEEERAAGLVQLKCLRDGSSERLTLEAAVGRVVNARRPG